MRLLFLHVLLLLPSLAVANTSVVCPEDYPTSLLTAKGVPSEWKGIAHVAGSRMVLTSAGALVGPPDRQVQGLLRGHETKTSSGYKIKFSNLKNFAEPQEKWVYCAYGMGGDIQLLERVPDDTETCLVEAKRNFHNGYDIHISCTGSR